MTSTPSCPDGGGIGEDGGMRLFVAVWPPPEVMDVLAALERQPVEGMSWSRREQWMVKLRPLGHVDPRVMAPRLADVLEAELDGAPAAGCVLGPETARQYAGTTLAVPVAGLDDLADVVFAGTEPLVPVTHPQPFHAAIVLARGRVPRHLAGEQVAAGWTARSVCLVADRSSPGRVRYENLAEVPLGSAAGSSTERSSHA